MIDADRNQTAGYETGLIETLKETISPKPTHTVYMMSVCYLLHLSDCFCVVLAVNINDPLNNPSLIPLTNA